MAELPQELGPWGPGQRPRRGCRGCRHGRGSPRRRDGTPSRNGGDRRALGPLGSGGLQPPAQRGQGRRVGAKGAKPSSAGRAEGARKLPGTV